jgi:hypothetical protein
MLPIRNETVWPWYTQVAPLSWLMAQAVSEGRNALNFSEWSGYQPAQERLLLAMSCEDATNVTVPFPEARRPAPAG